MTVEEAKIIDIVSAHPKTGDVILTISGHLDWMDSLRHQEILQAKLNAYLGLVEGAEIMSRFPAAKGKGVISNGVFEFRPDFGGKIFLHRAHEVIKSAGFELRHELFAKSYDN